MPMVKTGVVSDQNVEVIGLSIEEENAKVCTDCKRIVLSKQIKEGGVCPFCDSVHLADDKQS